MVAVNSLMVPLGTRALEFSLMDPRTRRSVGLDDFAGAKGFLVVFMCNHCPYVKHLLPHLPKTMEFFQKKGIAVIAINSNDASAHPDDAPEFMVKLAQEQGWSFPYLLDTDQSVAKGYKAMCTPDFFLFDGQRGLFYRGQYDDSRPSNGKPVTGADLIAALEALLAGKSIPQESQRPSMGCNIKWSKGNFPEYFQAGS